jgi:predicted hotdog family 3-hydroxylacyl-ACP dehydratase
MEILIMAIIEKEELLSLLPHRGRMLLLSRVSDYNLDKGSVVAEYDVSDSNIFYNKEMNGTPTWVSFECMAQTISILSGLSRREKGLKPNIGMILSVSGLKMAQQLLPEAITITVQRVMFVKSIYTFQCIVQNKANAEPLTEAKITVIDVDNIDDIIGHFNEVQK